MRAHTLRIAALFAILSLLVAACVPAAPAPGPAEKVTLKLATFAGVTEANEIQEILDRLNAASDTYEIVQESSPAEYYTKLQTTFAADTAADLIWVDQDHLPDFAQKGALLDITDLLKADDSAAAGLDDYFASPLDRFTFEGQVYGLPWIAMPVMLYVNLDSAEEAGYDTEAINDWDWDAFQEACVAMTIDANGNHPGDDGFDSTAVQQYGFSIAYHWPPMMMWIWQAGGEVLTTDLTQSPIDSPEAIQGAQYQVDLINKHQCTPQQSVISERGFGEMMKGGQVAMFMGGAADDFERTEGKRIKAFLLPQGPENRDTWAWIGGMSIYAQTRNPDAAYEAFMDLIQEIHEWKIPSPRISLANREGIIAATPYKEISVDNILANMPNMHAPRIFPGYAQWATVFNERYADPLERGSATAEELAPQVRPLLEEVLAEAGQ